MVLSLALLGLRNAIAWRDCGGMDAALQGGPAAVARPMTRHRALEPARDTENEAPATRGTAG